MQVRITVDGLRSKRGPIPVGTIIDNPDAWRLALLRQAEAIDNEAIAKLRERGFNPQGIPLENAPVEAPKVPNELREGRRANFAFTQPRPSPPVKSDNGS